MIIAIVIAIALLPVMLLLAIGNQLSTSADTQNADLSAYVQNLSAEQQSQLSQMESDGNAIANELTKLGLKTQIVKAQMIYFTYFDGVLQDGNFFADYCVCFQENDDEKLIETLNQKYGLSISYEEFMRSYAVISNISIDENRFLNLAVKNNIDLARWAENANETQWGYVLHSDGNVLYSEVYSDLRQQYPDEITEECDKWQSRRAVDNYNLLRSYLWYNSESRIISAEGYSETVQELFSSATVKGSMNTLPETVGTAVISGDTIGIYVGNDNVVYAKSVADGVVKESVSDGNWSAWFEIPWIQYGEEKNFSNEIQFEEYDPAVKNNLDLVQWAVQAHENGLIKGYGWYDSASGEIRVGSNGMMDVSANGMFENAAIKGTIDTIPEVPGLAVWVNGHIGIYIGNGGVIEAMNTPRGVTRTQLAGREWTHWLQIPYISYVKNEEED